MQSFLFQHRLSSLILPSINYHITRYSLCAAEIVAPNNTTTHLGLVIITAMLLAFVDVMYSVLEYSITEICIKYFRARSKAKVITKSNEQNNSKKHTHRLLYLMVVNYHPSIETP